MLRDGMKKVTQKWGKKVDEKREKEVKEQFDVKLCPATEIETDGGFVHIRRPLVPAKF